MVHAAPIGRTLPLPPSLVGVDAAEDDLACAATYTTPRPPVPVRQLARRILSKTQRMRYWIAWCSVAFALWVLGTAAALVLVKLHPASGTLPILALGFGGLGLGLMVGALWIHLRSLEARRIAREGQLVVGTATYRRSRASFAGELTSVLATQVGDARYCVVFSIGFIQHEMWVAFPVSHREGERHQVLVQPGARIALAFDRLGRGYVGNVRVRS